MTLTIDLCRALRDHEYRREVSEELDGSITETVMFEAADEIERLRAVVQMVFAELNIGYDNPDEAWADFTGDQVQQIADAARGEE